MDYSLIVIVVILVPIIGYLVYTKKITLGKIKALTSRKNIDCSEDQLVRIEAAIKAGDLSAANLVKNRRPSKDLIPSVDLIPVISIEKNASEARFELWSQEGPNVIKNQDRGRVVDLGKARPITIVIQGKTYIGFAIEGDRGVGLNWNLSESLWDLTTTAQEAWAFLDSRKLSAFLTDNLTGRQIALYMILGIIIGQLIFFLTKI